MCGGPSFVRVEVQVASRSGMISYGGARHQGRSRAIRTAASSDDVVVTLHDGHAGPN